jgi:transposase-like protein
MRSSCPQQRPADRPHRPRTWHLRLHVGQLVRQDAINRGEREGLTSEERERLRTLEAENAKLRMERDLLKRTVAFWVKETSTP